MSAFLPYPINSLAGVQWPLFGGKSLDELKIDQLARLRAAGTSIREIGRALDCSPTTVQNKLKESEVQEKLEAAQAELLQSIPDAVSNMKTAIGWVQQDHPSDIAAVKLNLGMAATKDLLKANGLLAGELSIHVQNIFNNQSVTVSPIILNLLQRESDTLKALIGDTIDIINSE